MKVLKLKTKIHMKRHERELTASLLIAGGFHGHRRRSCRCIQRLRGLRNHRERERDTNLPNPPYILIPRLLVEPQVFIQPKTNVIAVKPVCELAEVEEVLFECDSDCGLE